MSDIDTSKLPQGGKGLRPRAGPGQGPGRRTRPPAHRVAGQGVQAARRTSEPRRAAGGRSARGKDHAHRRPDKGKPTRVNSGNQATLQFLENLLHVDQVVSQGRRNDGRKAEGLPKEKSFLHHLLQ